MNITTPTIENATAGDGAPESPAPADPTPGQCPRCGSRLAYDLLYVGGRGYLGHDICPAASCSFIRRSV